MPSEDIWAMGCILYELCALKAARFGLDRGGIHGACDGSVEGFFYNSRFVL